MLLLQTLQLSWYVQLSPTAYHAHVQATGYGLVVGRLLVGGDDAPVVLTPIASAPPLVETVAMKNLQVAMVTAIPWLSLLKHD